MKQLSKSKIACLAALAFGFTLLTACDDDDSFSPVSREEADQDEELSSSSRTSSSSSARFSSSSQPIQNLKPILTQKGEQFNPDIDYGTMTDPRDGKTYRTVEIEGTTWMAENLNYADSVNYLLLKGSSRCYGDDKEMCELYGRLYSRDAAMNNGGCSYRLSCQLGNDTIQGICPDGWHIPTYSEASTLASLARQKASPLMSAKGWGVEDLVFIDSGADTYGLSFVGTGAYDTQDDFNDFGEYTYMWIYYQSSEMYYLLIRAEDNQAYVNHFVRYEAYYPVRCVKDE